MRTIFHLRPHAIPDEDGSQLPRGTQVEVLALTDLHRRSLRPSLEVHLEVLAQVRVTSTGAEGYVFLPPEWFAANCPVVIADDVASGRPDIPGIGRDPQTRPGFFRGQGGPLRGGWSPAYHIEQQFDANEDGVRDLFLARSIGHECIVHLVEWHTAQGWAAADVFESCEGNRRWDHVNQVIHAGTAVYFDLENLTSYGEFHCDEPSRYEKDLDYETLSRLRPDGRVAVVLGAHPLAFAEEIEWHGEADGSIRAVGNYSHRAQIFRLDSSRFALVPEGPQVRRIEIDYECPSHR